MKYYFLLLLISIGTSNLYAQKYDHVEFSIRAGVPENRSFFPVDEDIRFVNLFDRPEGYTNARSALSGEVSINWIKRSYKYKTRWALGVKAGVIPLKVRWLPNSRDDSFYPPTLYDFYFQDDEDFNVATHLFMGVTGGMRTKIFTIKKVRMDLIFDLGLIYGKSDGRSTGYNISDNGNIFPILHIEGTANPSKSDLGDFFVDCRAGYMFNFPIKDRNVGVGVSMTVSGHQALVSEIQYRGIDETEIAELSTQHVIYAIEMKYDLIKKSKGE